LTKRDEILTKSCICSKIFSNLKGERNEEMKKFFSFLLVLLALFTVSACIGEPLPVDPGDDEIEIDTNATYFNYLGSVENLNPYSETLANSSTLYGFLTDSLYSGDYDWDTAIELGIADEVGDFTNTALLPFGYFPRMATDFPVDVNGDGTVWQITLRDDLQFEDGTPIDADTFDYSWQQLLDPKLLNARATNLYSTDSLPLVNARSYFLQETPDKDALGFTMYTVGQGEAAVQYARANAFSHTYEAGGTWSLYFAQNGLYEDFYVENWGGATGWVLMDYDGNEFWKTAAGVILAPAGKEYVDSLGNPIPARNDEVDETKAASRANGVALPAYMDADGNRAVTDDKGLPVGGYTTSAQATPVEWEEVGFRVVDQYTFEITLTTKKSEWQVMTNLSSGITGVVHPEAYETGKIEGGARTTYGSIDNPLVSYGAYKLAEWVDGGYFIFAKRNEHYAAAEYRIPFVRYDIINDQSVAVNEFRQGRLDVAAVSGEFYQTYKNSPFLKLSPVTTFFRFAFSLDRPGENDNPIMQYLEFRQALYFAVDRETFVTDVRAPGFPTHGMLGPVYYSSEQNPFSYRSSVAGQGVLAPFSPETYGYDPVRAKQLFDEAYALAVANEDIVDGAVVELEIVYADAETNHRMADWLQATVEAIFNGEGAQKFRLVKNAVPGTQLTATGTGIWDTGNFDITFGGWQGLTFWAPGMLQVYSSGAGSAYMLEVGFETGSAVLEVDLARGKVAVQAWLAELEAKETLTEIEEGYLDDFEDFLASFNGNIFTGTYDELIFDIYYGTLDYDVYEGRDVDFDNITAALEGELLRQMIAIPLFTVVGATIYSERVVFEAQQFHARMGWGGLKYMFIKK
jgi:oligopeptide transport system substrate-binding protein